MSNIILNVPEGKIAAYEAATIWTGFSPISAAHYVTDSVCGSYALGDSIYTVSGMFNDTLITAENNDSIVSLVLTVLDVPVTNLADSACTYFVFAGDTLLASGSYNDTLTAANGCDSIVILALAILDVPATDLIEAACASYTLGNNTYTVSGTYSDTLTTTYGGCDSIVNLVLTILDAPAITSLVDTACNSFVFGGDTLFASGSYNDTLTSANGCDSIINLTLTINVPIVNLEESACNYFVFAGDTLFASGNYSDTLMAANNCDSITNLALTIGVPVTNLVEFTCASFFSFGGENLWASGSYNDTLTSVNNCDSVVILTLTINVEASILDSLNLTINGGTISAFDSDTLSYQWIDCSDNTIVVGETSSSFSPSQSGTYKAILSVGSCRDTTDCIAFTSLSIVSNDLSEVVLYPNPTRSDITIRLEQGEEFNMIMTNVLGEIVLRQELVNTETTLQTSGLNKGIYFVNLYSQKGNQTLRFVKH